MQLKLQSQSQKAWDAVTVDLDLGIDCGEYKWQQNQSYIEIFVHLPDGPASPEVIVDDTMPLCTLTRHIKLRVVLYCPVACDFELRQHWQAYYSFDHCPPSLCLQAIICHLPNINRPNKPCLLRTATLKSYVSYLHDLITSWACVNYVMCCLLWDTSEKETEDLMPCLSHTVQLQILHSKAGQLWKSVCRLGNLEWSVWVTFSSARLWKPPLLRPSEPYQSKTVYSSVRYRRSAPIFTEAPLHISVIASVKLSALSDDIETSLLFLEKTQEDHKSKQQSSSVHWSLLIEPLLYPKFYHTDKYIKSSVMMTTCTQDTLEIVLKWGSRDLFLTRIAGGSQPEAYKHHFDHKHEKNTLWRPMGQNQAWGEHLVFWRYHSVLQLAQAE